MSIIATLALKDLRLLLADPVGLFFTLAFPILSAVLFGAIFAGQSSDSDNDEKTAVPVLVIDHDRSSASTKLRERLDASAEWSVETRDDPVAAAAAVRAGDAVAYFVIPAGYGDAISSPFWGEGARLELAVDPSRSAERGMLQGALMQYAYAGLSDAFANPTAMRENIQTSVAQLRENAASTPQAAILIPFLTSLDGFLGRMPQLSGEGDGSNGGMSFNPVQVAFVDLPTKQKSQPKMSAYAVSFPQGIMWGILGAASAFGISLVVERSRGTLVRLRMAPIARWQILAGKGAACFVTVIFVCSLLLAMMRFVYGVQPQSWGYLALAVGSIAVCFVGIMMLLAVCGRTEASAAGIGWSVLLICSMFGGGMVPLFLLPGWVRSAGSFSPVKWSIMAMEGAIWRDYDLARMAECCGVLVAMGVIAFGVGSWIYRRGE